MLQNRRKNGKRSMEPIALASNVLMAVGAAIGLFVLAKAYLFSGGIPAGSCPLTINRPWIYASIALLLLSLVLSLFEPRNGKGPGKGNDEAS